MARGLRDRQAFEGVRPPPLGSVRLQALVQVHQRRRRAMERSIGNLGQGGRTMRDFIGKSRP
jgi:hypothetical protein